MNTCFSIMPFENSFDDIEEIIRTVALECGLEYVRSDRRNQPGSIMPQIVKDIKRASVVVADISGNNPNVFYELGIAHQIKGPQCVVIIKQQSNEKEVYDVHEYRQILYSHNNDGRAELRSKLPEFLRAAAISNNNSENMPGLPFEVRLADATLPIQIISPNNLNADIEEVFKKLTDYIRLVSQRGMAIG